MKVGVIGAGAWGSALSISSAKAGNDVTIWSYDGAFSEFPDVERPKNISVTRDISDIKNTDIWLIVVPSAFFRETVQKCRHFYNNQPIVICTKGMESETNKFMSEIVYTEIPETLKLDSVGILSGPQFAGEVASGEPTGSTIGSSDAVFDAARVALAGLYLEHTNDIIGVQVCGVGKNAVAILMGYLQSCGENEKALNLTRAWSEIMSFGRGLGAKIETFLMLCGIGDLFLTATSKTSRNFSAGVKLANNIPLNGETVEGVVALRGICTRAEKIGIRMPILAEFNKTVG